MKPTPYDSCWNNSRNWKWGLFYVCKEDPRIIVPKRPAWTGRTLNFAHPKAYRVLLLTILAIAAPCAIPGFIGSTAWWIVFPVVLGGIIAFYYLAKPTLD